MGYDGYIRVSRVSGREGESFQSPDDQRNAIAAFAAASNLDVTIHEPELDVTGSKPVRPILDGIMERVRAGQSEGVIVSKVNRLSRAGLGDAIRLVEEIIAAGATVGFAELGNVDPKTPTGEMMVNIWLSIAHMQWREYQADWVKAKKGAVARGAFVGPTPLGFKRLELENAKGKSKLIPCDDAPLVRRAFEISGEAGLDIALEFCRHTWPERHWSLTVLRKLFASRVYRGDVVTGDIIAREVIEPLVSEDVWYLAQHASTSRRAANGAYPLSGIARCAACGGPLVGHMAGRTGATQRGYRCTGKDCDKRPHVYAAPLEEIVGEALRGAADRFMGGPSKPELDRLSAARDAAQAELERYILDTAAAAIVGAEKWRQGLSARQDEFDAAQLAYNQGLEASRDVPDLDSPTPEELRRMIGSLTVRQGREPLAKRVKLTLAA